jgi:hypothetical protein
LLYKTAAVKLLYSVFFISFCTCCQAQQVRQAIAAAYTNLGAYSMHQQDVFSFAGNQAALAQVKQAAAGVYAERRFMLESINMYTAAVAMPSSKGNFGLNLRYMGFSNFNEYQLGLAYGRSLGKKVDVGIQFNYYGYRVPAYVSASAVTVELGAILHLTDKLNAGFHVYNPVGGTLSKTGEKIAATYRIGLGYDASEKFFVSTELIKEENMPVNLNAGFQYQMASHFFARGGVTTANGVYYGGFGVLFGNFRLDLAASWHPQLGISPGILLIMNLRNTDKKTAQ